MRAIKPFLIMAVFFAFCWGGWEYTERHAVADYKKQIGNLKTQLEELTEQNEQYKSANDNLKAEIEELKAEEDDPEDVASEGDEISD